MTSPTQLAPAATPTSVPAAKWWVSGRELSTEPVSSGWVISAAVVEGVIRRPSTRRARRARIHTALVSSR